MKRQSNRRREDVLRLFLATAAAAAGLASFPAGAAPSDADPVAAAPWTASLGGGVNAFDHDEARPFGSLALDRDFGDVTLGVSGAVVDSGSRTVRGAGLPSTTRQIGLSAGYAPGALSVEVHATVGWRDFATRSFARRTGAPLSLTGDGRTASAGGSLTYDLAIGEQTIVSPFAALDYSRVDIARAVSVPAGSFARDQREKGYTGSAGATLTQAFGASGRHNFGLYAALFATSNDASTTGAGPRATAPRFLAGAGAADRWLELGPSASFALSGAVHLDLSAIRTIGLKSGDGTTASAGLRVSF